jgi:outer membrane receptor for ferrienterochelin and colicins
MKGKILEEVVVTGTGTEHALKDAPVMTEIISGKTLSAYGGRSIEDILSGLSPSFDFNQNIMGSNMQLNGLGNNYILILIDGKRIHGDVGGQNDLNRINPANIERIEIVKGASSSLYGSDAIAGVINIITKKNHYAINLENTSRGGSYGDFQQYNTAGFSSGKWKSTTNFQLKHSDGWQNSSQEFYRTTLYPYTVTKTANRFTDYQIEEKIAFKPTDKFNLSAQASVYGKDIYRPCGEPQYSTYGMFYRNQSYDLNVSYFLKNKHLLTWDTNYDKYDYNHRFTAPTIEEHITEDGEILHPVYYTGDVALQSSQERILSHLKDVFDMGEANKLSLGLEYNLDILKSPYRIQSDKESAYTLSAYIQDEWSYRNINLTAGLRGVGHEAFGLKLTPKISALYKLNNWNLRATYSAGFKTPTLKELYYKYERTMMSDLRLYIGNTGLKPQSSNYYSAGIEYHAKSFTTSITAYYNQVKDMIELMEVETSFYDKIRDVDKTMQYQNIENARIKGVDFLFKTNIGKNLTLGGGYSYVYARGNMLNNDGVIEQIMLNGTALHRGNISCTRNWDWKKYKLGIGLFGKAQSKRFYRYDGDAAGYMTWRINSSHKLPTGKKYPAELNAGIDNILNYHETKPFGYNYGTTTSGRTYYVSLTLKFTKE